MHFKKKYMNKILLYGVLPLTFIGVSYYLYLQRKPSIENIDWLSDSEVTVNVDGKISKIVYGECLMLRGGYSLCAEKAYNKTLTLTNSRGITQKIYTGL